MAAERTDGTGVTSRGRGRRRRGLAVGLGAALAVTAGVVAVDVARAPQAAAAGLTPFTSCDELAGWYRDAALEQVTAYGLGGEMRIAFAAEESVGGAAIPAAGDSAAQDGAAAVGGPVGSSDTGTNVQEEGVDEPSRIKVADGVAWTLSGSRLVGVDLASGTVVGDLDLAAGSSPDDGTWFAELVLVGDRVVVIGSGSLPPEPAPEPSVPPSTPPSSAPPVEPTVAPTVEPTTGPTTEPSVEPSAPPAEPSLEPVPEPSLEPVPEPSLEPGAAVTDQGAADAAVADAAVADAAVADAAVADAAVADSVIGSPVVPWYAPTTTATTVDVSDPAAPAVVDRVEVEGGYVSARASGGAVRLVTTSTPYLPFVDPWLMMTPEQQQSGSEDDLEASEDAALARNRDVVRGAQPADWLPDLVERADDGTVVSRTPIGCDSVAHPGDDAGSGTLSVLTLDPAAEQTLAGTTSVAADGSVVYASTDRLYVATTRGGWLWGWGGGSGDPVTTELHGFDTTDPRGTTWLGSGSVEGWLLGSWAMDAHDGHLRVGVTSESPVASGAAGDAASGLVAPEPTTLPTTTSSVVVLRETPDGLVEVGRVDDLGPTETIRSLRWFDDLAVVVTFRQTDPLYTVDLTDPTTPRVLGELKVTGYSGYLHPVGDGMLLGVGQEADAAGTTQGTKVETYDVGDLAAPTAVSSLVWPQSSSAVEWDSRLFAYLPDRRTAVLPLERYDAAQYSSGLVAVAVGTDGSVTETGAWSVGGAQVQAVASTGDLVLVAAERWDETGTSPGAVLTVLSADGLAVQAEVPLARSKD
jgi:hypothetical protein